MRTTPNHEPHEQLVSDVCRWLDEHGFATCSLAYHDKKASDMTEADKKRFGAIYSPSALIVRHRPDRIAWHKEQVCSFMWEAKTKRKWPKVREGDEEIVIDLVTLMANANTQTGAKLLFVHRNQWSGHEIGFWIDELPAVSEVCIPDVKWAGLPIREWYGWGVDKLFPKVPVSTRSTSGTNDPFVRIRSEVVYRLPHWTDLITAELADSWGKWDRGIRRQKTPGPGKKACEAMRCERMGQSTLLPFDP